MHRFKKQKVNGDLYAWGRNSAGGSLGLGDAANRSSPVQVGSLTTWTVVMKGGASSSHSHALKSDGTLWSWGYNTNGRLGLGDVVDRSSPVQVGSLTTWTSIAA